MFINNEQLAETKPENLSLFSKQAVIHHADIHRGGNLLRVSAPSGTLISVLILILTAILAAVLFQPIQITASGRGVISHNASLRQVTSWLDGRSIEYMVSKGDTVAKGELLARITALHGNVVPISAPIDGRVHSLDTTPGSVIRFGGSLMQLLPLDTALTGYLEIPARFRSRVSGQGLVFLELDEYPFARYGLGKGRVIGITGEPMSENWPTAVPRPAGAGTDDTFLFEFAPEVGPRENSIGFQDGMFLTGHILLDEERIISMLIPTLRDLFLLE